MRTNHSAPATVTRTMFSIFFFQAEDGIRDIGVTGVQTCALPILEIENASGHRGRRRRASVQIKIAGDSVALKVRSEEHTSELQSRQYLVCRLLLEKKKRKITQQRRQTHLAKHQTAGCTIIYSYAA